MQRRHPGYPIGQAALNGMGRPPNVFSCSSPPLGCSNPKYQKNSDGGRVDPARPTGSLHRKHEERYVIVAAP